MENKKISTSDKSRLALLLTFIVIIAASTFLFFAQPQDPGSFPPSLTVNNSLYQGSIADLDKFYVFTEDKMLSSSKQDRFSDEYGDSEDRKAGIQYFYADDEETIDDEGISFRDILRLIQPDEVGTQCQLATYDDGDFYVYPEGLFSNVKLVEKDDLKDFIVKPGQAFNIICDKPYKTWRIKGADEEAEEEIIYQMKDASEGWNNFAINEDFFEPALLPCEDSIRYIWEQTGDNLYEKMDEDDLEDLKYSENYSLIWIKLEDDGDEACESNGDVFSPLSTASYSDSLLLRWEKLDYADHYNIIVSKEEAGVPAGESLENNKEYTEKDLDGTYFERRIKVNELKDVGKKYTKDRLEYAIDELENDTRYFFQIKAYSNNDRLLASSNLITTTTDLGSLEHDAITALKLDLVYNENAVMSWIPNNESVKYKVYYGYSAGDYSSFVIIDNPILINGRVTYSASNLTNGTNYYFAVKGIDSEGIESPDFSNELMFTPGALADDTNAPSQVSNLTLMGVEDSKVLLKWTAASDDMAISKYRVYYQSEVGGIPDGFVEIDGNLNEYRFSGLENGITYRFFLLAIDFAGNKSNIETAPELYATPLANNGDNEDPEEVTNLAAISSNGNILLSWDQSSDDTGVVMYRLYYYLPSAEGQAHPYVDIKAGISEYELKLNPSVFYRFRIKAFDAAGNSSEASDYIEKAIADTETDGLSVKLDFKNLDPAYISVLDNQNSSDMKISLTGSSADLEIDYSGSTGSITNYVIDKNIYVDSGTDGITDNDEDYNSSSSGFAKINYKKIWGEIATKVSISDADGNKDVFVFDVEF